MLRNNFYPRKDKVMIKQSPFFTINHPFVAKIFYFKQNNTCLVVNVNTVEAQ